MTGWFKRSALPAAALILASCTGETETEVTAAPAAASPPPVTEHQVTPHIGLSRIDDQTLGYRVDLTVPNGCYRVVPADADTISREKAADGGETVLIRRSLTLIDGMCTQALRVLTIEGTAPYRFGTDNFRVEVSGPMGRDGLRFTGKW